MAKSSPNHGSHRALPLSSAAISILGQSSQQISSLVLALLAAATLTVSDYGLYMLAVVIVELVIMFAHAGFFHFLINAPNDDEESVIATMFWAISGVGVLGGAVLWVASSQLDRIFDADGLMVILRVLAVLQPFGAIVAWATAYLIRVGHLGAYYVALCVGNYTSLALGAVILMVWPSIYALLAYRVLRVAINLMLFLNAARRQVTGKFNIGHFKQAWAYSWGLFGARFADYTSNFAADLLLAFFFTTAESGIYRIANRLAVASTDLFAQPLRTFAMQAFSETARREENLSRSFADHLSSGIVLIGGLCVAILIFGQSIVDLMFRSDYLGAILVMQLLAIRAVIMWPCLLLEPLLSARHKTGIALLHSTFWLLLSMPAISLAAPHGPETLATVQILVALGMLATSLFTATRHGGIEPSIVRRKATLSMLCVLGYGAALAVLWRHLDVLNWPVAQTLGLGISAGILFAGVSIFLAVRFNVLNPHVFTSR